jgi:hypothetical protein
MKRFIGYVFYVNSTTSNANIVKSQNVQQYYIYKMSQQFYTTKYPSKYTILTRKFKSSRYMWPYLYSIVMFIYTVWC